MSELLDVIYDAYDGFVVICYLSVLFIIFSLILMLAAGFTFICFDITDRLLIVPCLSKVKNVFIPNYNDINDDTGLYDKSKKHIYDIVVFLIEKIMWLIRLISFFVVLMFIVDICNVIDNSVLVVNWVMYDVWHLTAVILLVICVILKFPYEGKG